MHKHSKYNIKSTRELARRVGRSNSSVAEWLYRSDWPFGPPPWPASIVDDSLAWMESTLDSAPDPERISMDAPGRATVTRAEVLDPSSVFFIGKAIPDVDRATVADAESFAELINTCIVAVMCLVNQKLTGKAAILSNAAPGYYAKLIESADNPSFASQLVNLLSRTVPAWASKRFPARRKAK